MATVVRVKNDPYKRLGESLSKSADTLARFVQARMTLDKQDEWKRQDREFQDEQRRKSQEDILARQRAAADRTVNAATSKAETQRARDTQLYRLFTDSTTRDSRGYRVFKEEKIPQWDFFAPALLASASDDVRDDVHTKLGKLQENSRESAKKAAFVKIGKPLGLTAEESGAAESISELNTLTEFKEERKVPGVETIKAFIVKGTLNINDIMETKVPAPGTEARNAYEDATQRLEEAGITRADFKKFAGKWASDRWKNQNNLRTLQESLAKEFPHLAESLDTPIALNVDADVLKVAITALKDGQLEQAFRRVTGAVGSNIEPAEADVYALMSNDKTKQYALQVLNKFEEKKDREFDWFGGRDLVEEITKYPLKDHSGDKRLLTPGIGKNVQVQSALKMSAMLKLVHADAETLGALGILEPEGAEREEQMTKWFDTYLGQPEEFWKQVIQDKIQGTNLARLTTLLQDLSTTGTVDPDKLNEFYGLLAKTPNDEYKGYVKTLITAFSEPRYQVNVGGHKLYVGGSQLVTYLELGRKFDMNQADDEEKQAMVRIHRYISGDPSHPMDSLKLYGELGKLTPNNQKDMAALITETVVRNNLVSRAIASGLLPADQAEELRLMPLASVKDRITNAEGTLTTKHNATLSAALQKGEPLSVTTFEYADASIKTAYYDMLAAQGKRAQDKKDAQILWERDRKYRVRLLQSMPYWPKANNTRHSDWAIVNAASKDETLTTTLIDMANKRAADSTKTAKEKTKELEKANREFLINKVWTPFLKDFPETQGGLRLDAEVTGWDTTNNVPRIVTDGGKRVLKPAEVQDLRALHTEYQLFDNWLTRLGIDQGILGSNKWYEKNAKGERQYKIATAGLIKELFRDTIKNKKIPSFDDIYTYAHAQAAKVKYVQNKDGSFSVDAANWKKLTNMLNIDKDITNVFADHTIGIREQGPSLIKGTLDVQRRRYFEHFESAPFLDSPDWAKFQNMHGGDETNKQKQLKVIDYIMRMTTASERNHEGKFDTPGVGSFRGTMLAGYALQNLLTQSWPTGSGQQIENLFESEMQRELDGRKGLVPSFRMLKSGPGFVEKAMEYITDSEATASTQWDDHHPYKFIDKTLLDKHLRRSDYEFKDHNYWMARLAVLKKLMNNLGGGEWPTNN